MPDPVPDYSAALTGDISGLRLGVPTEYFAEGMDAGVRAAVTAAIDQLATLGAEIREVSLPTTEYALACYYIIAPLRVLRQPGPLRRREVRLFLSG